MKNDKTTDILKKAIMLELQGKTFYEHVASNTKNPEVKEIFRMMAGEEDKHIGILQKQFKTYNDTGRFNSDIMVNYPEPIAKEVLTEKIRSEIKLADFEAAAISAAIDMENKAVKVYSDRAGNTSDADEKKIYEWLSNWEVGHSKILEEMNVAILEESWNDNSYWPF